MNKRIISAAIIIVATGAILFSTKEEGTAMKLAAANINWGQQINRVLEKNSQDLVIKKDEQSKGKEADEEIDAEQVIQEIAYEENETKSEEEPVYLPEMEWALFLETEVSKGVAAGNFYWRYGIYGNFTGSQREGEAVYFSLNESILEKRLELTSTLNRKEEEESYENNHHRAWAKSKEEHIAGCSSDLEWIVTWQMGEGVERWYKNGEKVYEHDIEDTGYGRKGFISRQTEEGILPMEEKMIIEAEEMLEELYGTPRFYSINYRTYYCFGSAGGVLASANETGWKEADAINIYSLTGEEPVWVYELPVLTDEMKWPIQIWQVEGDEHSGWILFSYGYETFRITYPEGETEKLGEYMFAASYSPDEKYLAYCTGNEEMWDCGKYFKSVDVEEEIFLEQCSSIKERWKEIPQGWYVIDLATGEKSYIPVPYWEYDSDRPLYGGRCTWVEKDKLLELLEMEASEEGKKSHMYQERL